MELLGRAPLLLPQFHTLTNEVGVFDFMGQWSCLSRYPPVPWASCLGCGRCISTSGTSLLESHEEVCPYWLCLGCYKFVPRMNTCYMAGVVTPPSDLQIPPIQKTLWHRDLARKCIERRQGPTPEHTRHIKTSHAVPLGEPNPTSIARNPGRQPQPTLPP